MKTKLTARIHCPRHGLQNSNNNAGYAVACIKCYPENKDYKALLMKQWSRKHKDCKQCGGNGRPHKGRGLCVRCWERLSRNKTPKRKKWQKEYRVKSIEKIRKNNDKYNHSLRKQVIDCFGGKCKKCGFGDKRALQIDHINGGGYQEIKNLSAKQRYKLVLESVSRKENKYQLLCANCNWIKRFEDKEIKGAPRKYI